MFGIRYTSTTRGSAPKFVTCEECGHKYGYWMERSGSDSRVSWFLIARNSAQDGAHRGARAELARRLREECDVVPCPECGHVQDAMVPQAREDRFGWIFRIGIVAGIGTYLVLTVVVFLVRTLLFVTPRQREVGQMLTGMACPLAFLVPALAFALKKALAQRFHPNHDLRKKERLELASERVMSPKEHDHLLEEKRGQRRIDPYEGKQRLEDY